MTSNNDNNNDNSQPVSFQNLEEAARWHAVLTSNDAILDDFIAFDNWLMANDAHADNYAQVVEAETLTMDAGVDIDEENRQKQLIRPPTPANDTIMG